MVQMRRGAVLPQRACRPNAMTRLLAYALCAALAAHLAGAAPELADPEAVVFDAQRILDAQRAEIRRVAHAGRAEAATGRAQFMSCGYIAPRLTEPQPPEFNDDSGVMDMLERLRAWLRDRAAGE
jgi:hypothetical protein